jgi:hypothetical protein
MKRPHSRTLFACLSLAVLACSPLTARAQAGEQCSLDQISAALNSLPCEPVGAFVSPESIVESIVDLCEYAPTEESCHRCFRRARDRVVPSMKTLIKLHMLPTATLRDLRDELLVAEDDSCYQGNDFADAGSSNDEYGSGGGQDSTRPSRSRSGGGSSGGQNDTPQSGPANRQRGPVRR